MARPPVGRSGSADPLGRAEPAPTRPGARALLPAIASVGLAVVVLGPALRPGYVLNADQVFVPEQDLLPWMLGVGGGLPRSVPQDAVVAVLSGPVPGWVWEKSALVAAVALLALGTARLVGGRGAGRGAAVVAALVAAWSGYAAERLLMGHWSLLLAVAALPWALAAASRARDGDRGAGAALLLWSALASLTVSGGLLVSALALPVLLWRGGSGAVRGRVVIAALVGVLQLPWLVPALLHPSAGSAGVGADVFAARAEGPWGLLLTLLGTGGIWNSSAVPASRTTLWGLALGLVVLAVAAVGARDVRRALGGPVAGTLAVASALGLLWAALGAWEATQPIAAWIVGTVPGGGVLRDAHKWLAPWLLLLAAATGLGAARIAAAAARRSGDALTGRAVLVAVALLPLVAMPDLAWGASGRLAAVPYPADLAAVRAVLDASPAGDAVSLPWQPLRRFPWNLDGRRTSLDPVPRAMPRTTLVAGTLVVARGDELVAVPGDDPRAARVDAALAAGRPLAPVLAAEGIAYAVVASDLPGATDDLPPGSELLYSGESFSLYGLPLPPATLPSGLGATGWASLAALLAAVMTCLGAAVVRVLVRRLPAGTIHRT